MSTATTDKVLPGAEELFSEFAVDSQHIAYSGDCGEFAELCTTHIATGVALTPDNMHAIVRRDIDHGWTSANGGEPLSAIAADLQTQNVLHTLYNYPGPSDWLDICKSEAGVQPVILEVSNGQNLAGDETGLQYHFITVVGRTANGAFLCCDGDNIRRDDTKLLCEYTPDMLIGAKPCGLIVVKFPQKDPFGYVVNSDGSITYNHSGIHLIGATADFIKSHNIIAEPLYEETYYAGSDYAVTPFANGIVLVWSAPDHAILLNHAGECIARLLGDLKGKPL